MTFEDMWKSLEEKDTTGKYKQAREMANLNVEQLEFAYNSGYADAKSKYERPRGKWIKWNFKTFGGMGDWEYKCSNCEKVYSGEYNFCPNCGAKMKGGMEND